MAEHKDLPAGEIHVPHQWKFSNQSQRAAFATTDVRNLDRLALQDDNGSYWRLVSIQPTVWQAIAVSEGQLDTKVAEAQGYANNAAASQQAAENASDEAAEQVASIRSFYYGALSTDPTVNPDDGSPLVVGGWYLNTSNIEGIKGFRVYTGLGTWETPNINGQAYAAPTGSQLIGYGDLTVQDALDDLRPMATLAALRSYSGNRLRAVQVTDPLRAGEFYADPTDLTTPDDDGAVIVDGAGMRWKRLISGPVNPKWWGALGGGYSNTTRNDTDALRRMGAFCARTSKAWDITGDTWRIRDYLDLTDVPCIRAEFSSPLVVDRTLESVMAYPYAVYLGRDVAGGAFVGRATGMSIVGSLSLVCSGGRAIKQHGVYVKGGWFNIDYIHADDFNGTGVNIDSVWDSAFRRIRTERCGNLTDFSFVCSSVNDTANCFNIVSLQVEQAYHKGMHINLLRGKVQNIHCERLLVMTLNDGASLPIPGSATYCNHFFLLGNTKLEQGFIDAVPAGTPAPDGSGNTVSGEVVVFMFGGQGGLDTIAIGGDLYITGGQQIQLLNSGCNRLFQNNGARQLEAVNCTFNEVHASTDASFVDCNMGTFDPLFAAERIKVSGGSITSVAFAANVAGSISFRDVLIQNLGDVRATFGVDWKIAEFIGCDIVNIAGGYGAYAKIYGGRCRNVALVSQACFMFDNVDMVSFNYSGNTAFITNNCRAENVINWTTPGNEGYPNGTTTERPNYIAGQPKRYVQADPGRALNWIPA